MEKQNIAQQPDNTLVDVVNNKYETIGWKVDLQEDFMNDGSRNNYQGKLAISGALDISSTVAKIERTLRMYGFPILGSMDWHNQDSEEFPKNGYSADFKETFPEHCIAGTYGAEFIEEARLRNPLFVDWNKEYDLGDLTNKALHHDGEIIFRKDAFDVFSPKGNKYAKPLVKELNIKTAFIYGVALEVCNDFAVKGLLNEGIRVFAVTDAMKAIDETVRTNVLNSWEKQGATLVTSNELYSLLSNLKNYE